MLILGKPVLSTQVAGSNELLDNGHAGLIVENSEEGIYCGLKTMLTDHDKYAFYCNAARERAKTLKVIELIRPIEKLFEM